MILLEDSSTFNTSRILIPGQSLAMNREFFLQKDYDLNKAQDVSIIQAHSLLGFEEKVGSWYHIRTNDLSC